MRDINHDAAKINTAITNAMTKLKDIKTNTLLNFDTPKAITIKELHNIRDGSLMDMVTFQNIINTNTIFHLKAASIKIEANMKETLNTYVINHTARLQDILINSRQSTCTDLFVDL